MKNNKLLYLLGALTIIAIVIAVVVSKKKKAARGIEVEFQMVSRQDIIQTVTASGKIYPEDEVRISSDVSGEIIELNVKEGDLVKKGELLARIKPDSYQALLEQSQANLNTAKATQENAKAQMKQVEAQLNNAQLAFDRAKDLYDKKVVSKADYETAETTLKSTQAQYEAAKHSVDGAGFSVNAAAAAIKDAQNNLSKTTIYAPMDGIVSLLNVKKGEKVVGTWQMSGTEMMRIANFKAMEVRVDVSEGEIPKIKIGDTADVEVDAYLDRKFLGVVTEIANTSKGASNVIVSTDQSTNFVVKIRLLESSYADLLPDNPKPFLPGMSATVDVKTRKKFGVIAAPIQAVTTKDTLINGSTSSKEIVFINNKGKAKLQEVKTGIQNDTYIEITEGLNGNEQLVSGPYNVLTKELHDGDNITLMKPGAKKEDDKKDEEDKEK